MSVNPKTNTCGRNSPQGPRNFKHYGQKQTIQMQGASLSIPPKGGAGLVSNRRKWDPSSSERELEPKRPDSLLLFQNQTCHLKVYKTAMTFSRCGGE